MAKLPLKQLITVALSSKSLRLNGNRLVGTIPLALELRGGSNTPYEFNPNYQQQHPTGAPAPLTLGDLERNPLSPPRRDIRGEPKGTSFGYASTSFVQSIGSYFARLHNESPILSLGTITCCFVFYLWHVRTFQSFLQRHFVCSRINIIRNRRYPALLLSAVSHASFSHLLVNLWAFVNFGKDVKRILSRPTGSCHGWKLWPLVVGSAIAGSLSYLVLSGRGGAGCMGLSGVTLSFIALYTQAYPQSELGFVVGVIPIRLPAQLAMAGLFIVSILGSLMAIGDGVAHSAHLGGLLFGIGYYQLWLRREHIAIMTGKVKRTFKHLLPK